MPYEVTRLFLRPAEAGIATGDAKLGDVQSPAHTATTAAFATTTTQRFIQFKPGTSNSTQYSTATPGTTATGAGWGWNVLLADINPDAGDLPAKRRVEAGNWVIQYSYQATQVDTTAAFGPHFRLYKRAVGGASYEHLASWGAANASIISVVSPNTATLTAAVPEVILENGESLHMEVFMRGKGGGTLGSSAQTVTLTFQAPTSTNSNWVTLPGQGLRYEFLRPPAAQAAAAVDTITRRLFLPRSLAQTVQGTDLTVPVARSITTARGLTENIPTTSAVARKYLSFRTLTETTSVSDALARRYVGGRGLTESILTTSTLTGSFRGNRSITESVVGSDALGRKFVGGRGLTESYPIGADTLARLFLARRGLTETLTTADALARRAVLLRALAESILTVDSLNRLINVRRFVAEFPTGVTPDYATEFPTRKIAGIVKNQDGTPFEGATVKLFRAFDDKMVQQTTSAADGSYQFLRDLYDPYDYFVVAYEEVGTRTQGLTIRGLVPVSV